ncbi:MAG: hypothetical protein ABI254_06980, partial [Chthoniobacterales bacterium]
IFIDQIKKRALLSRPAVEGLNYSIKVEQKEPPAERAVKIAGTLKSGCFISADYFLTTPFHSGKGSPDFPKKRSFSRFYAL